MSADAAVEALASVAAPTAPRARAAAAIIIVVVSIASMAAVQNRFDDLEYIKISWRGFDLVVRNRFEDLG